MAAVAVLGVAVVTAGCPSSPAPCTTPGEEGALLIADRDPVFVGLRTGCRESYAQDLAALAAVAGLDPVARYGPWLSRDGTAAILQGWKGGVEVLWYGRRAGDTWTTAAVLPYGACDTAFVSFSADGRFAAATTEVAGGAIRAVRVDLATGRTHVFDDDMYPERSQVCLSSDGARVAYADKAIVLVVWDCAQEEDFRRTLKRALTFNDKLVGFLDDGRLAVQYGWDYKMPSVVRFLSPDGVEETAFSLPFGRAPLLLSPDGSMLVFRDGSLWAGAWSYGVIDRAGREREFDLPSEFREAGCWTKGLPRAQAPSVK